VRHFFFFSLLPPPPPSPPSARSEVRVDHNTPASPVVALHRNPVYLVGAETLRSKHDAWNLIGDYGPAMNLLSPTPFVQLALGYRLFFFTRCEPFPRITYLTGSEVFMKPMFPLLIFVTPSVAIPMLAVSPFWRMFSSLDITLSNYELKHTYPLFQSAFKDAIDSSCYDSVFCASVCALHTYFPWLVGCRAFQQQDVRSTNDVP